MGLLGSSKKKKKETSKTITYGNGDVYVGEFKEGKDKDGKTVDVKVRYRAYDMHFSAIISSHFSHTILCHTCHIIFVAW